MGNETVLAGGAGRSLVGLTAVIQAEDMTPGQKCPTCERRIPHPRKPDSPKSKVKSFRIPEDVAADYDELLDAATVHAGVAGKPFSTFATLNAGLVLVLQAEAGFLVE